MLDTVCFWLKKGVDGYRLDIINALFEDEAFRDAPLTFKLFSQDMDLLFKSSSMNFNHPDTIQFCKKLRQTIDEFEDPSRFMVGEIMASVLTVKKFLGENADGLNMAFLFKSLKVPLKAKKIRKLMQSYEEHFPEPFIPTWVFGNHDVVRRISKLKGSIKKAKLNAALQLTARGVPFIYYGEEIGIPQARIRRRDSLDPLTRHFQHLPHWVYSLMRKSGQSLLRDECRTPMQWDATENAGFSPPGVRPWLPLAPSYEERNVATQENDPDSLLHCYKRLLRVRKETPALHSGDLRMMPREGLPSDVLAYVRSITSKGKKQKAYVFLNLSDRTVGLTAPVEMAQLLTSTTVRSRPHRRKGKIELTPWEGIVLAGD